MLKMTRKDVDRANGKQLTEPSAPSPEKVEAARSVDLAPVEKSINVLAATVARAAQAIAAGAQQPAPPKQMEAVIHRDKDGRMERVTITVKQEK